MAVFCQNQHVAMVSHCQKECALLSWSWPNMLTQMKKMPTRATVQGPLRFPQQSQQREAFLPVLVRPHPPCLLLCLFVFMLFIIDIKYRKHHHIYHFNQFKPQKSMAFCTSPLFGHCRPLIYFPVL